MSWRYISVRGSWAFSGYLFVAYTHCTGIVYHLHQLSFLWYMEFEWEHSQRGLSFELLSCSGHHIS
jgi:hypothetical protein